MNPFKYGRVVSKLNYCPRPDLEAKLKSRLLSAQNIYMEGERRTGKTSLIFETAGKLKSKRIVYIDLLEVKTIEDIHKRALNGVVKAEENGNVLQNLLKKTAALRPAMTFDPMTGIPSLSIDATHGLKPESLDGLLDLFAGREFRNVVIVIDEFQDILNLQDSRQVLAVMRSKIQFLVSVPFVFCGSLRSKMNMIFNDPNSPFYKSALPMEVGPIDRRSFKDFLAGRFAEAKIGISSSTIDRILQLAHDNPGDTQQLCSAIFDITNPRGQVGEETIREALQYIFAEERKGYEAHLARITGIQLKCLAAVARFGGISTLSGDFLRHTGIRNPSTVKKALSRLEELKILFTINNEYKYVNPFFAQWLVWMNY
jgi:AAA+ ATPase superfamily predicted ATPase